MCMEACREIGKLTREDYTDLGSLAELLRNLPIELTGRFQGNGIKEPC